MNYKTHYNNKKLTTADDQIDPEHKTQVTNRISDEHTAWSTKTQLVLESCVYTKLSLSLSLQCSNIATNFIVCRKYLSASLAEHAYCFLVTPQNIFFG